MHGENLFLLIIFSSGVFILYFTFRPSLIFKINNLLVYMTSVVHLNDSIMQVFKTHLHRVQSYMTVLILAKTPMCTAMNCISSVVNRIWVLCGRMWIPNCSMWTPTGRSCISNYRTCVLYYWSSFVQNGICAAKNSSCVVMNSTSSLSDGSSNLCDRTSVLKNSELHFISDTVIETVSTFSALFEYHFINLKKYSQPAVSCIRFQLELTKNFVLCNILILQKILNSIDNRGEGLCCILSEQGYVGNFAETLEAKFP